MAIEVPAAADFRCGYVAIAGRPNVGKSTLLNRLVGERVSITSKKAQTTRHRVTGIVTRADGQILFVDTPGFQTKHRSRLTDRMNRAVTQCLADVDAVAVVLEAGRTTEADRAVIRLLPKGARAVAALNKIDRMKGRDPLLPQMAELAALFPFAAIVPVSAEKDRALDTLLTEVRALLPVAPAIYGPDEITDRDERFLAAEFVREKIFRLLGEEVPYATTVTIDSFLHEGELRRIHATIHVDHESQRGILVGAGGERMKEIATAARADMERLFGGKVYLEVWVKVTRGWAEDEAQLSRFGY
jgi:GTP-binding protein Era